jgi:hypothetical protein
LFSPHLNQQSTHHHDKKISTQQLSLASRQTKSTTKPTSFLLSQRQQQTSSLFFWSQYSKTHYYHQSNTTTKTHSITAIYSIMKTCTCTAAFLSLLVGSASAFAPSKTTTTSSSSSTTTTASTALKAVDISDLPGAIDPTGPWDPLGFAEKADIPTMKRYREAEVNATVFVMMKMKMNSAVVQLYSTVVVQSFFYYIL